MVETILRDQVIIEITIQTRLILEQIDHIVQDNLRHLEIQVL